MFFPETPNELMLSQALSAANKRLDAVRKLLEDWRDEFTVNEAQGYISDIWDGRTHQRGEDIKDLEKALKP